MIDSVALDSLKNEPATLHHMHEQEQCCCAFEGWMYSAFGQLVNFKLSKLLLTSAAAVQASLHMQWADKNLSVCENPVTPSVDDQRCRKLIIWDRHQQQIQAFLVLQQEKALCCNSRLSTD